MRAAGWLGGALSLWGALAPSLASAQTLAESELEIQKRERAALLSQTFQEAVARRSVPALAPIAMGLGAYEAYVGIRYGSPLLDVAGGTLIAGGVGFYLVSERRNYELLLASMELNLGLVTLALPFEAPHPRWQIPVATGYFVTSALAFVNFAYSRHPGRTRLFDDWRRVRTPAGRHGLSQAELLQIERDLYDTDPFVPNWLMGLPTIAGALIGAVPLFDRDVAGRDKLLIASFSVLPLIHGLGYSLSSTPADQYRSALSTAGLWATWTPTLGGVSVVGGFD